jgi:hypothetical protein
MRGSKFKINDRVSGQLITNPSRTFSLKYTSIRIQNLKTRLKNGEQIVYRPELEIFEYPSIRIRIRIPFLKKKHSNIDYT